MKFLFASDIHGSLPACKAVLERLEAEQAARLILLGDPALPRAAQSVAGRLQSHGCR